LGRRCAAGASGLRLIFVPEAHGAAEPSPMALAACRARGALAFPKPNISAAVDQIEKSRRDLLAPLTEIVSRAVPLGSISAPIVSRLIFTCIAPEIKVRPYRPPAIEIPVAARCSLHPHGDLLLHQHSRLVARERVSVSRAVCRLTDKHCPLSARSDAPRSAIRFHGTYPSNDLADRGQSKRCGPPPLHADVSHVRRHVRDIVAVHGVPLCAAALESAASTACHASTSVTDNPLVAVKGRQVEPAAAPIRYVAELVALKPTPTDHPMADRPHGLILRSASDRADGRGLGIAIVTV